MAKIIRRSVDTSIEQNIVTAAIISDIFLEETAPLYDSQYMTSSFTREIMKWVMDYFSKFGEAPKQHIKDIFTIEKQNLEDAELELIETFLENLSSRYVEGQGINDQYIIDQTLQYYRKREIEVRVANAQALLNIGRLDKAEDELNQMKKVMKLTSKWHNPMSVDSISKTFDDRNQGILKFPGEFGEMFGPLERGWTIAILAPFKRGKTWLLQEAVVIAAAAGLKAVFVSLEMQPKGLNERLYKRISAYKEPGSDAIIPVYDCKHNQKGNCGKPECVGTNNDIMTGDQLPEFDETLGHMPCARCKGIRGGDYDLSTWFEKVEKKDYTEKNIHKKVNSFVRTFGDNIRIICYPKFSAGVSDLDRDLDMLEQTEGFIPDLIAVDYPAIMKPEGGAKDHKAIDDIWKNLAGLFARRHAVGFTAAQGNRGALYKTDMDQTDLAEWIGSLGHVDIFAAVNQSKEEKKRGLMRLALFAHRHKEFHEGDQTTVLQAFSLGQVHLDSF